MKLRERILILLKRLTELLEVKKVENSFSEPRFRKIDIIYQCSEDPFNLKDTTFSSGYYVATKHSYLKTDLSKNN